MMVTPGSERVHQQRCRVFYSKGREDLLSKDYTNNTCH